MNKPNIFIASSSEALTIAEAVNIRLENIGQIKLWDNAFELSSITITKLIEKANNSDYAVFVFHNDDKLIIRDNHYSAVRDNVLFELGLFMGKLGLENCFILAPSNFEGELRLPTDLSGVTISYYNKSDSPLDAVTSSCAKVKMAIVELEKAKSKRIEKPGEQTSRLITDYQSEIWMNKHEIEILTKKQILLESLLLADVRSKTKPATPREILDWENGAKETYMKEVKIAGREVFYTNRDIILPPLYGAHAISIIVEKGCEIRYSELGHNSIFYMDGFRMLGL